MRLKLPLFLLSLIANIANAQESLSVKGSKPYPATQKYVFICEKYAFSGELDVQVAKTEKGGILKLSVAIANDQSKIFGGVYVDLANGDVIACVDKNVKETADGKTTAYYYFTPAEMLKLKKTDIQGIRFIIVGNSNAFSNETGHFTAVNKNSYFSTAYDKSKKTFDTAKEISIL
ncbi:hypothetical protein ACQ9BO_16530 [Flavobacterium sp. P21]|uniref:hypothetical protein n=1 Tax=Flavobacterium sp. P21 TaxID=3423948 RepID=UPI003D677F20